MERTPVGTSFMRGLVDYETTEDAPNEPDGGGAPDAPDTDGALEQAAWAGPSQEEWQALTQFQTAATPILQNLHEILSAPLDENDYGNAAVQQGQYQQQPGLEEEWDPFDQDSVARIVDARLQAALEPFQGLLGMVATEKGEALARSELDTIRNEVGEFDNDTAFLVASGLIESGHDPATALRQAASYAQQYEQRIREDERKKVTEELTALRDAPRDGAIGAQPGTENVPTPTGANRYEFAIRRALANGNPALPAG